jgi:hypothetical protein
MRLRERIEEHFVGKGAMIHVCICARLRQRLTKCVLSLSRVAANRREGLHGYQP